MRSTRLIVNADDFGWTRGITDGILLAHRRGIVTSTSLMVNQPATAYAVEQLASTPQLSVGIHLNLTDGRPVLTGRQVPSLVDSRGRFHPFSQLQRRLWRLQIRSREVEAEFRAQIQQMKSLGLAPTHADSHHHLHMHPLVAKPFVRAVRSEGITRARQYNPFRGVSGDAPQPVHKRPLLRHLLVRAYVTLLRWLFFQPLDSPDAMVVPLPAVRLSAGQLSRGWHSLLEGLPAGTFELGCHPGLPTAGLPSCDVLREKRELELSVLTDPQLRDAMASHSIELIAYSQL